ncbi:hypothetical protein NC653_039431 [Populus alba x Populus x berolinensis]|uniref:Uncharacterized protein n=1 Tax=Populus alba x Populus x berolinensis TaxID=444605 RepID=A0AAD6LB67_9ROSI|nr:hypothetical protein NC653_039431 [Populus alba x Populus x berolinensis]
MEVEESTCSNFQAIVSVAVDAEGEDVAATVHRFTQIPTQMLMDGCLPRHMNQSLGCFAAYLFGVYDGHGDPQILETTMIPDPQTRRPVTFARKRILLWWRGVRESILRLKPRQSASQSLLSKEEAKTISPLIANWEGERSSNLRRPWITYISVIRNLYWS